MKKEDLIVGKWYKLIGRRCFGKLTDEYDERNNIFPSTIYYNKEGRGYREDGTSYSWKLSQIEEATYEDLKSILPENHPDLKNFTPEISFDI